MKKKPTEDKSSEVQAKPKPIKKKKVEEVVEKVESKPSSTKQILIVIAILAFIVVFTIFAYERFLKPVPVVEDEVYEWNNYEFRKSGELWITEIQVGEKLIVMPLHYTPHDARSVYIGGLLNESFNEGPIYITFDPTEENLTYVALATAELSINLAQGINRELIAACALNVTEACAHRPIVDCDSEDKSVIYLMHGPTPFVQFEQNCIIITGEGDYLVRAVDKLLYYWYGMLANQEGLPS